MLVVRMLAGGDLPGIGRTPGSVAATTSRVGSSAVGRVRMAAPSASNISWTRRSSRASWSVDPSRFWDSSDERRGLLLRGDGLRGAADVAVDDEGHRCTDEEEQPESSGVLGTGDREGADRRGEEPVEPQGRDHRGEQGRPQTSEERGQRR